MQSEVNRYKSDGRYIDKAYFMFSLMYLVKFLLKN